MRLLKLFFVTGRRVSPGGGGRGPRCAGGDVRAPRARGDRPARDAAGKRPGLSASHPVREGRRVSGVDSRRQGRLGQGGRRCWPTSRCRSWWPTSPSSESRPRSRSCCTTACVTRARSRPISWFHRPWTKRAGNGKSPRPTSTAPRRCSATRGSSPPFGSGHAPHGRPGRLHSRRDLREARRRTRPS